MSRPTALSEVREVDFVLEDNRKDKTEEQTTFKLKSLKGKRRDEVRDRQFYNAKVIPGAIEGQVEMRLSDYNAANRLAAYYGLVGWENFQRANGDDIRFPGKGAACIEHLGDDDVQEIGERIREISELTEEETKN